MHISATIKNINSENNIVITTNNANKVISIPNKPEDRGSLVNGGELLFLSLATYFCNDIYREAKRRNMYIESIEVKVQGEFGKEGENGSTIIYEANVIAPDLSEQDINNLINYVDKIAEIHNALRQGVSVSLQK